MCNSDQRTEDHGAEVGEQVQALEELAPPELRRRVVEPDPETILDPSEIRRRPLRVCGRHGGRDGAVAIPDDDPVLDALADSATAFSAAVISTARGEFESPLIAAAPGGRRRTALVGRGAG
jgi:hypothetical protein